MEVSQEWRKWPLEENRVTENSTAKILWEEPVRRDKTVKTIRADIILAKKDVKKLYLICNSTTGLQCEEKRRWARKNTEVNRI